MKDDARVTAWLRALDERHLANLTPSEIARALRALSSCYVERRQKLARGGALESAGKRAAFALFYSPLHFLITREIVRSLHEPTEHITHVLDLGCGTGAAGAAWALECRRCSVHGIDRHPWTVMEANWTYRSLGIRGRATQGDIDKVAIRGGRDHAILAAYAVNELPDATRDGLLPRLLAAHRNGARILIVEPIARGIAPWWDDWKEAFMAAGGSFGEWRFAMTLADRQRQLARAAGLDPRDLTARTLSL
jgi:hypothetical protein